MTNDFYFYVSKENETCYLRLESAKGKSFEPDFRRYTGDFRLALREFSRLKDRQAEVIEWYNQAGYPIQEVLTNPGSRMLDLAAKTGLLRNPEGDSIKPASGLYLLGLKIGDRPGDTLMIKPTAVIEDNGDEELLLGLAEEKLLTLSSNHLLYGTSILNCVDLGSLWARADSLGGVIRKDDAAMYLSLAVSQFESLVLEYEGHEVGTAAPRTVRPGLIFQEIDAYGYLHILPISCLPGFPPHFFDQQEIIKVVEIDTLEKCLTIAEIVFPASPKEEFQVLLDKMGKEVRDEVYEEDGHYIISPQLADKFLSGQMGEMVSRFELYKTENISPFRIRSAVPRVRLSLGPGIDYFEGSASIDMDGELFPYGQFLSAYRKDGYVKLNDGTRMYPEPREMKRLERILQKVKSRSDDEDIVGISFFDLIMLDLKKSVDAPADLLKRITSFYHGFNQIAGRDEDFTITGSELRPYQKYGVQWLKHLQEHRLGGCLADDMGLGKTVQVISLLRQSYARGLQGPSLIIAPRSLIYNWLAECSRFAPELPVMIHYGSGRDTAGLDEKSSQIILSSYSTIRIDAEELQEIQFAYLILDESQNIKNMGTKRTAAILSLKARHRIALSGTPVENNLAELYSLFRFLNPSFFGSQARYLKEYARPIQEGGDTEVLHDLKSRIYPFLLRRMKKDVLKDLPPKTEQTAFIELDKAHLAIYHRRREELYAAISKTVNTEGMSKASFMILRALGELRRLAGVPESESEYAGISAKREYLKDMVSEISQSGHKSLIFTNYLSAVEMISEDFTAAGMPNLIMTGATSNRQELVNQFQSDPTVSAFIMTLKTGGVGLNLTAADYVFIVDPWWNRAAETQAIDRTHRIGQTNPVFCYRMIARETIEEKILELQNRKSNLMSSLLTADTEAVKSLTREDLAFLME